MRNQNITLNITMAHPVPTPKPKKKILAQKRGRTIMTDGGFLHQRSRRRLEPRGHTFFD